MNMDVRMENVLIIVAVKPLKIPTTPSSFRIRKRIEMTVSLSLSCPFAVEA